MTEQDTEVALKQWGADLLALRVCVLQLLEDQMRGKPEHELRAFAERADSLLAAMAPAQADTFGGFVHMLAQERLAKLINGLKGPD